MNKSDIKIIFVDIDWTLYNHFKHCFDFKSIKALKKVQANGVKVFISTARPYDSAKQLKTFDYFTPDGIVCTNGAVVLYDNKVIYNDYFDIDLVKKVISICDDNNLVIELANEKERFFNKPPNEYFYNYLKVYVETVPEIRELKDDEHISAMLVFCPKEYDEAFVNGLENKINPYRFTEYGIDLHTHPIYKSDGVKAVLNYLNIDKDNAMAIGDSIGDVPMFEVCKYAIAMKNGSDEAKKSSTYITKHINRHGIKHALKHFKII